jgi:glucose/arabinose dehydrogenase
MSLIKKIVFGFLIFIAALGVIAFWFRQDLMMLFFAPTKSDIGVGVEKIDQVAGVPENKNTNEDNEVEKSSYQIVAEKLTVPWQIAFLPSGEMIITERVGRLVIFKDQPVVIAIDDSEQVGEGGLLGMALHPNFSENNFLYLYLTTRVDGKLSNKILRYRLINDQLTERTVILEGIPGSQNHDGGRIAFGPDGLLYATTGDASQTNLAQDLNSLAGKILRMTDDGKVPAGNPFDTLVYSSGHRNPQGITWDQQGKLWATEHGRSGVSTGFDELNIIEAGKNYGWPTIQGPQRQSGLESPIIQSGSAETWAPAGMVYWDGSIFFTGLRGAALYEAKLLEDNNISLVRHFPGQFGRLRDVVIGPDGMMYIATSNTDGRGKPQVNDDKIIKLNPMMFR